MSTNDRVAERSFIGVAWPYVNGDLHIGHLAGYLIPADVTARFLRHAGSEVLMVSGSDCFGTPITVEADKRQISAEELVSEYHPKVEKLFKELKLSFDIYTLTMHPNHKEVVQEIFLTLMKNGYITTGKTLQYHSASEGRFLPDRYVEGTCPKCNYVGARSDQCDGCGSPLTEGELVSPVSKLTRAPVQLKETQHYFLDWPKLQPFLERYVDAVGSEWRPWVIAETRKWLKEGLRPRAITRDLNWGVEIPIDRISADQRIENHENKRIYVWFEAVIGYLSAAKLWATTYKKNYLDFWSNKSCKHYYFMGKDNLVFHTLFWPGQLHGYNPALNLPDCPAINNFLTCDGQKFSKSRGVFVDPRDALSTVGLDSTRFYMCAIAPETADADFTMSGMVAAHNSILAAKVGNFVSRALTLAKGIKFNTPSQAVQNEVANYLDQAYQAYRKCEIRKACDTAVKLSDYANRYITEQEPWALKNPKSPKFNETIFKQVMTDCVYLVLAIMQGFSPILIETVTKIEAMLSVNLPIWHLSNQDGLLKIMSVVNVGDVAPLIPSIQIQR